MNTAENVVPKKYLQKARKLVSQELMRLEDEIEKKTKEEIPKAKERLLFLKWESLRRHPEYKKFYSKIRPIYESAIKKNPLLFNYALQHAEERDFGKFGLTCCLLEAPNPKTTFKNLRQKNIFDVDPVRCKETECTSPTLKPDYSNLKELFKQEKIPEETLAKKNQISVEVRLMYSETRIMREMKKLVEKWLGRKKKFDLHTKKTGMTDLKKYFKAYDLHINNPQMAYRKIAAKVFRKHHPSRNDERKISLYCDKAKEFIKRAI